MKNIKRSISLLLALLMVAGLFPAVPFTVSAETRDSEHFSQDGDTCTIHDAAGWDLFCDMLAEGETFAGKTVQLAADVGTAAAPVTRMAGVIGDDAVSFQGVFDGGGYTLYFSNTTVDDNYIAPFRYVSGSSAAHACIHDLNVNTTINSTGYRHLCGLIALTKGYVDVVSCNAEIDINCGASADNSDLYPAGIVSQVSSDNGGTVTVTGCTVTGTITSGGKYAAGLVGIVQGTATVENCLSSVVIKSTVDGDGTHGGLVAVTASNSTTTIEGCVFNGKLLTVGENDTGNCGGILGWKNASVTIKNCLYAPAAIEDGEKEVVAGSGDHPSGTFYRGNAPTLTNCYYIRTLGTAQAKAAHTITAGQDVTVALGGEAANYKNYDVSGISTYGTALAYNGTIYAGKDDEVTLTLGHDTPTGYSTAFTANAGTLNGNTLTMPDSNVVISANDTQNDYTITTSAEHGAVTVTVGETQNAATAHYGDTVTLTVMTDTGYELKSLIVKDADDNDVTVTDNNDGTYSFDMPASNVTVMADIDVESYFDSTTGTLTLKGTLLKGSGYSDSIILPKGVSKTDVLHIVVDDAGATFPQDSSFLFYDFNNVQSVDLTKANTGNVTDMTCMFFDCNSLTSLNLSSFDTSSVTEMHHMFFECQALETLDLSGFNTSSVADMGGMFANCYALTSLDLSGFDTSSVIDMHSMFDCCNSLTSLDLSSFDTSNVDMMIGMFEMDETNSLTTIYVGKKWSTANVRHSDFMFYNCTHLTGGNGTVCDGTNNIDKTYAVIDGQDGQPGYLTGKYYNLTVNAAEHGTVQLSGAQTSFFEGDVVTLTVTPDTGWSLDVLTVTDANNNAVTLTANGTNTWTFPMPASDVNVAASFAQNDYSILVDDAIQHGSVTVSQATAHCGDTITLTVTPDTGWSLDVLTVTDWNNNAVTLTANGTNTWTFPMPASDVSVAASFAQNDYSILVDDAIQHGSVTVSQATAHCGDTVTLTVTPDTGCYLYGVSVIDADGNVVSLSSAGIDRWSFTMPASDVTVTAAFWLVDYPIVIPAMTNGSVTASVNNAPVTAAHYGDLVTLTAAPDSSCRLESLAVTDANGEAVALTANGTDAWTFVMPAGQVTVTASFVKLYPVVIAENIPNGTLTANVTEAAAGDVVTLTATPDQGFVLVENGLMVDKWHGPVQTVTNSQFVMPDNGVTVTACFLPPAKSVTYIDETGGSQTVNAYPLTENVELLPGGWYVAEGDIDRSENLELHHTEDIRLILADGCNLTITSCDPITGGGSDLYLYGQAGQSGCLTVTGEVDGLAVGALWVSGGRIRATGGDCGIECLNAAFTIYAGTVEAIGIEENEESCGIWGNQVVVYGGTVTARGTRFGLYGAAGITIFGGNVSGIGGQGGMAYRYDPIELGWTNPADSIYASSFCNARGNTVQVSVTDGQYLKYVDGSGKHFLSGTLTADEISQIAGQTLLPAELWTVNLADVSDGFLTANTSAAEAGDTVTVVFNGDSNFEASFTVTDADGNAVPVTEPSPNRCSFTMPASDVTVTATVTAYYTVTVVAPVNGSLTASATRAAVGELVTLTAVPDQGFVLVENGLIVLADNYFSPELLPVTNDQFTMPKRDVTVAAAFLPAAKSVNYIDETGTEQTVMAYPLTEGVNYLPGGWYVAEGDLNLLATLTFVDDARLILADGCRMTVSSDSAVLAQGDLTFYGQAGQTGSFAAKAPQSSSFAFTPWGGVTVDGNLSVCGGNVISATDGERCFWVGESLTVLRGTLEAVGNVGGPAKNGILCDSLIVSGGAVSAEGRQYGLKTYVGCRISGGNVSFSGGSGGILDQGAGIELGWTEPTDSIYASSYSGSVTVAEDTTFVNDDDPPMMISEGPVEDLSLIDGFTLLPPGGSFVIHVNKTGTGTVLCPATAFQGEIVNLTVIPTGSSALSALSLKDSAGNELTLSDDGNNSWSFTMPADHVTLEIRFEELYHVYIDSGIPHGAVTADKTWAAAGELVTLTCTPDAGYVLVENSVVLSDASYNYVSVYDDQFLMPANNVSVTAAFLKAPKSVAYVDETGRTKTAMAYPLEEDVKLLPGGWYAAEGTLNFGEFSFYGTTPANLILADGCQMSVEPAWAVYCGEELSIYGQSGQTGTLSIHGGDTSFYTYADLYICGGRLELSGNSCGLRCDKTVWIYGGTVEATATGSSGSGIMGYRVCLIGGTVNASGAAGIAAYQNIEFYGGNVSAVGSDGGIWPGEKTLLSWTDPTDSIYASSYRNSVTVLNGMSFVTDDDPPVTIPEGPVDNLSLIDGKTLTPLYETHSITVLAVNGNGTVTADKLEAYPGETVTLTAAPAQGFVLIRNGLLVETELGSVLPVTNGQFTMPASDVTVTAAFLPAEKEVSYVDYEGKDRTHLAYPLAEGTVVLPGGWYVAEDALSLSGGLSFRGEQDAYLILADGCVLTVSGGPAALEAEDDLSVFGQSGQTGSLIADGGMYGILARGDLYLCGGSVSASGDIVCIECWDSLVVFDAAVDANGSGAGSAQYGIRSNYCDVEGGSVRAQGSVGGVCMQDRFRFVCGSLWAAGGEYGLASENTINLSWRELTDSVYVSSYQCEVYVDSGKSFVTDDNPPVVIPAGMVDDLDLINGRTLTPENLPHSVSIWSEIAHGALTADKETAMAGEIVTLTAVPDAGWVLAENGLLVLKDSGVTVPVTNGQFVMPACDVTVSATFLRPAKSVSYIDENGLEQTVLAYPLDEDVTYLPGGWYVAEGNITRNEPLGFVGSAAVHLILADGCQLSAGEGASCVVYSDPDLRFYGQSGQTGSLLASGTYMGVYGQSELLICGGVFTIDAINAIYCTGDLRIVGGTITVGADPEGSTEYGLCGDTIHITGGTVNARAEYYGICSWNGFRYSGGNVVAVGDCEGIYDEYSIDLSWTDPTDSIYASSWYGSVTVSEGKSFVTDDDPPVTIPAGPVSDLSLINGKTLTPKAAAVLDAGLKLYTSLNLGVEITQNISVRKNQMQNFDHWYIQVDKLDADGNVLETLRYGEDQANPVELGNPMHSAVFAGITAKEMGVSFAASVHCFDADGNERYNVADAASFKDYIISELLNTGNADATRTLCADMLNYGAAAQSFFGYDTEHLVNANLSAAAAAAKNRFETKTQPAANLDNTASANMSCSVSVMNRIVVSILGRRLNAGSAEVKFEVRDGDGNVRAVLDTTPRGSSYTADFDGLEAGDMRTPFTFTALVNGVPTGAPAVWSVEGYVKEARSVDLSTLDPETRANKEKELALFNALLNYVDSVEANGS